MLTGGGEGPVARALAGGRPRRGAESSSRGSAAIFPGRLHVELQRHRLARGGAPQPGAHGSRTASAPAASRHQRRALRAGEGQGAPRRPDRDPQPRFTRRRREPARGAAGAALPDAGAMHALFADLPEAVDAAAELAERLDFTLADLGYRFPEYPLPPGETPSSYLRQLTWNGARARFRPLTAKAQAQLDEGARDDREARPRRLLPDRLGRRALLPREPHPRPGARLGRQQRRLLRALDHGGRSGEDGAALRALPLGGARRVARHRPRPAVGRSARARHPARLRGSTARTAPA